ncbi:hypothetical protein Tco_0857256 [Tanacetum coccineum]|uniref:Uncharacterized protein n=1 Tax=Tanacetum coccineum TaxID=301880 RepID=A0ABQ5B9Z4_9ASTR
MPTAIGPRGSAPRDRMESLDKGNHQDITPPSACYMWSSGLNNFRVLRSYTELDVNDEMELTVLINQVMWDTLEIIGYEGRGLNSFNVLVAFSKSPLRAIVSTKNKAFCSSVKFLLLSAALNVEDLSCSGILPGNVDTAKDATERLYKTFSRNFIELSLNILQTHKQLDLVCHLVYTETVILRLDHSVPVKKYAERNKSTVELIYSTEPSIKECGKDEAGPSTFQDESDEFIQDDTLIADLLVNISKSRRGARNYPFPVNMPGAR